MNNKQELSDALKQRKADIPGQFYEWIAEARVLIDDNFPNERASAHNALIIETAKSMMMMHQLSEIEVSIDDIRYALENPAGS